MDLRVPFQSLDNPNDILALKNVLSKLAFELDAIYTTTAPNGNISARQGTRAVYLNGATYEYWVNVDGNTTWQKCPNNADVVLLTGDQTIAGVKTFSSIPELPASDPTTDNQAARKSYIDDFFDITTGHDHDGTDSKKVLATNLDGTGVSNGQFLKSDGSSISGGNPAASNVIFAFYGNIDTAADDGFIEDAAILGGTPRGKFIYWGAVVNTSYTTVAKGKWKKVAGVNTVSGNIMLWLDNADADRTCSAQINIGGATGSTSTVQSLTPTSRSWTVDVSGLSDGTEYDILIQLKNHGTNQAPAHMAECVGYGS